MIRASGLYALTATAMPEISPPPETGTSTVSSSGQSPISSRPMVPWPAMTWASSKGETMTMPCAATRRSASTSASSWLWPTMRTSAPSAAIASSLLRGTRFDTQTIALTPCRLAACATARPWLPVETVTTPRARSAASSAAMRLVAPRILKAPVSCSDSSLSRTSAPVRAESAAEGINGVCRTVRAIASRARSMSRNSTLPPAIAPPADETFRPPS